MDRGDRLVSYRTQVVETAAPLWSDGRGKILVTIAAGWGLSMGVRMVYPVLLPHIRDAYGLGLSTAGLLLTILFLAYALGQLPSGLLTDRFGERVVLATSMFFAAGTLVLVVTATSVHVLFLATALFGASLALFAIARYTALTTLYSDHLGAANGVTSATSDASQSLLPAAAGVIAVAVAWQYGFVFALPLFVLIGVALWIVVPESNTPPDDGANRGTESSRENSRGAGRLRDVASQLRQPTVVGGTAILTLGLCIWQAFTGFYPTYLIEVKGFSPTVASGLFGVFFGLGVLVKPLSGGAYDRIGVRRSLLVVMGISGSALAVLPMIDGFVPILAVTALVSVLLGFTVVVEPYLLVSLPEDVRGTGFGVLRTIGFTVGSASPVLFGWSADRGYFDEAFFSLALIAALMIGIVLWLPTDRHGDA
jgi:predicted MFS family arabinose efflux permease